MQNTFEINKSCQMQRYDSFRRWREIGQFDMISGVRLWASPLSTVEDRRRSAIVKRTLLTIEIPAKQFQFTPPTCNSQRKSPSFTCEIPESPIFHRWNSPLFCWDPAMAPTAAAAAPVARRVVARSALSGQLLSSAESVEEVQQQITRQLGVSSAWARRRAWNKKWGVEARKFKKHWGF